jgi:hypothetical protein
MPGMHHATKFSETFSCFPQNTTLTHKARSLQRQKDIAYFKCKCGHGMARPRVADRGDCLQIWRVAANILNKQPRTADSGWSTSFGVGRGGGLTNPTVKLKVCYETLPRASDQDNHSENQGVDGRMGSEWILVRLTGEWTGFDWLRIGTGG